MVQLFSLGATASLLVIALRTLVIYAPDVKKLIFGFSYPIVILRAGIAIGLISTLLDNSYWAIPWGKSFLGHDDAAKWINFGPFVNLPVRQILTIAALFLHLKADEIKTGDSRTIKSTFKYMAGAFILTVCVLGAIKWH